MVPPDATPQAHATPDVKDSTMTATHRPEHLPPGSMIDSPPTDTQLIPPTPSPLATLPVGHLACRVCGVAVEAHPEDTTHVVRATHREGQQPLPPHPRTGDPRWTVEVEMLLCTECASTEQTAEDLLDAVHFTAQYGKAQDRFTLALNALRVIGQQPDREPTAADIKAMARALASLGRATTWEARYAGVAPRDARTNECTTVPFGHVSHEARSEVRAARARMLAVRVAENAPPRQVLPPPASSARAEPINGGCLMCGVAAVEVPAAEVARRGDAALDRAWQRAQADPRALGGVGSPTPISGHLCPPCSDARQSVGSLGVTACERAMKHYLREVGRDDDARVIREEETTGLAAWGALVHRQRVQGKRERRPSAEPWAHVNVRR